jgi:hypothetical protein
VGPVIPCYTDPVLKKLAISLDSEVALWARRKGADEDSSVSELITRLLRQEMSEAYWRAYEEWKRLPRDLGAPEPIDASQRFTRDEAHELR